MKTLKINSEFAHELVLAIPYAYWLHTNNQLDTVITSKGMSPFYYFCDSVIERFETRTIDNTAAGINELPNPWIHHNATVVVGKGYGELSEEQQNQVNGVLDYSQWKAPPYKNQYNDKQLIENPYIVVNNNYNIEFGNPIENAIRFFDIKALYNIFNYLVESGYIVIYKRPDNTEFPLDQNEQRTLAGNHSLTANVDGIGNLSDYDLCEHYSGKVINLNKLKEKYPEYSYNELQLRIFANSSGFVTPNGGGGILCGYFDAPVVMHVPHGKELRTNYLTNPDSYYQKLSNNTLHAVIDPDNESNYKKVIDKIKEVF
jgi:hypothetical protein